MPKHTKRNLIGANVGIVLVYCSKYWLAIFELIASIVSYPFRFIGCMGSLFFMVLFLITGGEVAKWVMSSYREEMSGVKESDN